MAFLSLITVLTYSLFCLILLQTPLSSFGYHLHAVSFFIFPMYVLISLVDNIQFNLIFLNTIQGKFNSFTFPVIADGEELPITVLICFLYVLKLFTLSFKCLTSQESQPCFFSGPSMLHFIPQPIISCTQTFMVMQTLCRPYVQQFPPLLPAASSLIHKLCHHSISALNQVRQSLRQSPNKSDHYRQILLFFPRIEKLPSIMPGG